MNTFCKLSTIGFGIGLCTVLSIEVMLGVGFGLSFMLSGTLIIAIGVWSSFRRFQNPASNFRSYHTEEDTREPIFDNDELKRTTVFGYAFGLSGVVLVVIGLLVGS